MVVPRRSGLLGLIKPTASIALRAKTLVFGIRFAMLIPHRALLMLKNNNHFFMIISMHYFYSNKNAPALSEAFFTLLIEFDYLKPICFLIAGQLFSIKVRTFFINSLFHSS